MNKLKIAVLAVQETHLDDDRVDEILSLYGHKIIIIASHDPNSPRVSAGVAFVINKKFIKPKELIFHELRQGRALALKIKWGEEETVLLNVYAPNNRSEHKRFWEDLDIKRRTHHLRRPDFLLGDFNLTEDNIDRAPAHPDDPTAVSALRELRHKWDIQDTWRHTNPSERLFTYRYMDNDEQKQSRIDRIYTTRETAHHVFNWNKDPTFTPTDHWLIMVRYAPQDAPYIGTGCWTWPIAALQNNQLMNQITTRGIHLQEDIDKLNREHTDCNVSNRQLLWRDFKLDITSIAKKSTKESYHKITSRSRAIMKDLDELAANPEFDTNENLRSSEAYLAYELSHLRSVNAQTDKDTLHAKLANHGEKLGGIWSAISKDSKPRDLINRLKIPNSNPPQYERDTVRMAQLARDYHHNLQTHDLPELEDPKEYEHHLNETLSVIPATQLLEDPTLTTLNGAATQAQVEEALHMAKNGTAMGLDRCPFELWKALHLRYIADCQLNKVGFNIANTLTEIFNDIQIHGTDPNSNFSLGWMCPIFKKKDPTEISNYRPITLMNTDYKLLTKVLALQLMTPIHRLVHPDQAGFIPQRSIFNHTKLAHTIIHYAEVMDYDGAIIALDQEKAYDKIRHDYLWKTLEAFQIPQTFIRTVKSLYKHAQTQVAINGVLSEPFPISRGVRQGDPLSCALFDIAIEPLACMLRSNPDLTGISIPGLDQNILVTMFADDTTLFLNKHDRFDTAQNILDSWCRSSGAKFNIEKTEVIPIGTEEHRQTVIETRKINTHDLHPVHENIRIAKDGEAIRSLGTWIGNHTNDLTPWEPILDNIRIELERWGRTRPTLDGRKIIIQIIIGGHTQFLTKAQGMPPEIENALTKITRDFLWGDDSSPRIALDTLYRPIEEGGLNLLDIKARNEAIEITWLKAYLSPAPSRPTWAKVTDLIINASAPPGTSPLARINAFLQSWNPPTRGPRSTRMGNDITRMLKTAKKHGTAFAPIRLSPHLRAQLPAWYHPLSEASPLTTTTAKCLLKKHTVTTVADLISTSARLRERRQILLPHTASAQCLCTECARDREKGCRNPHACATEAQSRIHLIAPKLNPLEIGDTHDNLSLTPSRKQNNREARRTDGAIRFDPSITCKHNISEGFRIFTSPEKISNIPARRYYTQGINHRHRGITVYTDGASINNGKLNARSGGGVWVGPNHERNTAIRVPGPKQSNQVGKIAAVIVAVDSFPKFWPLTIISDSKYAIEGLTTHLPTWEDNGWIGIKNAEFFKHAAYLLRSRIATTDFKWVKGHDGVQGNEQSDLLAKEGANKADTDILSLEIPKEFDLQGAKLATITQSTAYRGIQERKPHPPRATSTRNIQTARNAIHAYNETLETDETLWKGIRNRSLRTRVQQFLYKTMHGTQKIGSFWSNIPNYEMRQYCTTCHDEIESMEHILTRCDALPTRIIWDLAKSTWPHSRHLWPEINIGIIMGCGSVNIPGANERAPHLPDNRPRGASRLLQILVSEAAHLIWVLRCERVIQERPHTLNEIQSRWLRAINTRLTDDKIIATKIKRNAYSIQRVKNTWEHVLKKHMDLPTDWIDSPEVLVGRRTRAPLPGLVP